MCVESPRTPRHPRKVRVSCPFHHHHHHHPLQQRPSRQMYHLKNQANHQPLTRASTCGHAYLRVANHTRLGSVNGCGRSSDVCLGTSSCHHRLRIPAVGKSVPHRVLSCAMGSCHDRRSSSRIRTVGRNESRGSDGFWIARDLASWVRDGTRLIVAPSTGRSIFAFPGFLGLWGAGSLLYCTDRH